MTQKISFLEQKLKKVEQLTAQGQVLHDSTQMAKKEAEDTLRKESRKTVIRLHLAVSELQRKAKMESKNEVTQALEKAVGDMRGE